MSNADRVSEVYKGEIWSVPAQERLRARIDWMVAQARGDVLDVGCSQGIATLLAARRGCHVHGVDIEADRIEYAAADLAREPAEIRQRVRLSVADITQMGLPESSVDTVLLGEVIEHLADPDPILAAVVRLLRPSGRIVLTTPFGYSPHHDHRQTFYPASLLALTAGHMTVDNLDIVDGYLRLLATPGPMAAGEVQRWVGSLQPALERHLLATERGLREARGAQGSLRAAADRAAALRADLEAARRSEQNLRRRLATAQYRAQYASWQLTALRTRRWYRAGQAVLAARRGRTGVARLPAALLAAVRPVPRPSPPRRVDDPTAPGPGPVAIPEIAWPDRPIVRADLTVATILDPFTAMALRYEWHQLQPTPRNWRGLLTASPPDLLFVESAWRGNDGAWSYAMTAPDAPKPALRELVSWCRTQGIPTVFWNKEDPPNYDRFIATARLFDHVFTVDGDLLARYRTDLGHDRVDVLPFAAQPRLHNPTAVPGGRVHDVAFAGTYFSEKHPGRREQMKTVLDPARDFGLHIYSRMGDGDRRYAFPPEYRAHIVGSLPYEQMLAAYRMYRVFLNVNSVTESTTMCARRVFELAACRTPVVSGESRAITQTFAQLVPTSTTPEQTSSLLASLLANPELRDRQAHLAQRLVLAEHTFSHRVDAVLHAVGLARPRGRPSVSILLSTNRPDQIDHAIAQVARQRYGPLQLVMVIHGAGPDPDTIAARAKGAGIDDAVVLAADASHSLGGCLNLALAAADGELLAKMDDDNLYGEHYLADLVAAFSYTDAAIVGKWAHYVHLAGRGATLLRFAHAEHAYTELVQGGTIVARGDLLRDLGFDDVPRAVDTTLLRRAHLCGARVYSGDRFSFVSVRSADPGSHTWQITDLELLRAGTIAFYGDPTQHVMI